MVGLSPAFLLFTIGSLYIFLYFTLDSLHFFLYFASVLWASWLPMFWTLNLIGWLSFHCLVAFLELWSVHSFGPYFFVLALLLCCKGRSLKYSPGQCNPRCCVVGHLDECFFFNYLVVGLQYSLIFWQFWLFFIFKFVVFLLVVQGGTVYLPTLPSLLEVKDFYLFIFRKGKGGRKRGRELYNTSLCGCLSHAPTGDLASNPSMCPDWESNWQPFGLQSYTSQGYILINFYHWFVLFLTSKALIYLECMSIYACTCAYLR